jgi:ribosomal protein L17
VAIVVTKKEIKEVSSTVEVIATLAKSKEFRQDLNMAGAYWFYHP